MSFPKSVLRVAGYIALGFVTLEIAARIDDFIRLDAPLLEPYTINRLFRPSPNGREGVPLKSFGKWQMNTLGYRGPQPVTGRQNVLAFGASETFGLYESAGQEFPRLLEERLNATRPSEFNVINIALPGIRIGRVAYLEEALKRTTPRYVIIYPSPANYIGTTSPFCREASKPVATPSSPLDHVRLTEKMNQLIKKSVSQPLMTAARRFGIWLATREHPPMDRVPESSVSAFRDDLICAVRTAQRHGAEPILVTHATYFGSHLKAEDEPMLTAWRRFYPELREEGFLDLERRANDAVRSVANDERLALVDAAAIVPPGPRYFADFVHFTDLGAAKIADGIAPAIAPN